MKSEIINEKLYYNDLVIFKKVGERQVAVQSSLYLL